MAKAAVNTQAPAIHAPRKASFVTVASKMPMSVQLQLCREEKRQVTGRHGTIDEVVYVPSGAIHVVRGTAYPSGSPPEGFPDRPQMIRDANGGYALTPGVPAEFWAAWLEQNAQTEMVVNGMIKAQADLDSLAADAKEHASVDSGLGPLNPKGDRRSPKPSNSSISDVKAEQRPAA